MPADETARLFQKIIGGTSGFSSVREIAVHASEFVNSPEAMMNRSNGSGRKASGQVLMAETRDEAIWGWVFRSGHGEDSRLMRMWKHGLYCGKLSEIVASLLGLPSRLAFSAGLLHDVGKILLYLSSPGRFEETVDLYRYHEGRITTSFSEKQVIGIQHGDIGAFAADKWNLREDLTRVILSHHVPLSIKSNREEVRVAQVVRFADAVCWSRGFSSIEAVYLYAGKSPSLLIEEGGFVVDGMSKKLIRELSEEAGRILEKSEIIFRSCRERTR